MPYFGLNFFGFPPLDFVTCLYAPSIIFGSIKEPKELLCVSVCPFGTKLSKALNLYLSLIGQIMKRP